jgi:hypothetical protein
MEMAIFDEIISWAREISLRSTLLSQVNFIYRLLYRSLSEMSNSGKTALNLSGKEDFDRPFQGLFEKQPVLKKALLLLYYIYK